MTKDMALDADNTVSGEDTAMATSTASATASSPDGTDGVVASAKESVSSTKSTPGTSACAVPATEMLYVTYEGNFLTTCEAEIVSFTCKPAETADGNEGGKTRGKVGKETKKNNHHGDDKNDDDDALVLDVEVCLNRTVMHAQGGGQPSDRGEIIVSDVKEVSNEDDNNGGVLSKETKEDDDEPRAVINVKKVVINRGTGVATHLGTMRLPPPSHADGAADAVARRRLPAAGNKVRVNVDVPLRRILSECHTAGHVVDSAMAMCGKTLRPSKAYHFLDGPYVEYHGSIDASERGDFLAQLRDAFQRLVRDDVETKINLMPPSDAHAVCNNVATNFDVDQFADPGTGLVRVVTVAGYPSLRRDARS